MNLGALAGGVSLTFSLTFGALGAGLSYDLATGRVRAFASYAVGAVTKRYSICPDWRGMKDLRPSNAVDCDSDARNGTVEKSTSFTKSTDTPLSFSTSSTNGGPAVKSVSASFTAEGRFGEVGVSVSKQLSPAPANTKAQSTDWNRLRTPTTFRAGTMPRSTLENSGTLTEIQKNTLLWQQVYQARQQVYQPRNQLIGK